MAQNLRGLKFGEWIVQRRTPSPIPNDRHAFWCCLCSCGRVAAVRGDYLVGGKSTKCVSCRNRQNAAGSRKGRRQTC